MSNVEVAGSPRYEVVFDPLTRESAKKFRQTTCFGEYFQRSPLSESYTYHVMKESWGLHTQCHRLACVKTVAGVIINVLHSCHLR